MLILYVHSILYTKEILNLRRRGGVFGDPMDPTNRINLKFAIPKNRTVGFIEVNDLLKQEPLREMHHATVKLLRESWDLPYSMI